MEEGGYEQGRSRDEWIRPSRMTVNIVGYKGASTENNS
jgi:hypothetical protein